MCGSGGGQWRTKLRSQQHQHEKEQDDHAIMLRELQRLLSQERMAKEHLEQQVCGGLTGLDGGSWGIRMSGVLSFLCCVMG